MIGLMSTLHAVRPAARATAGRQSALERAARHFDGGVFLADLARLVAVPSESQEARGAPHLAAYLTDHLRPALEHMGFLCQVLVNPAPGGPLLLAERTEDPDLPTVLVYGHGDVVRGLEDGWLEGLSPWALTERDGRLYGRGVADNKGQHAINLAALAQRDRRARPPRLQRQVADRDQRGDRLAGPARDLREPPGPTRRRSAAGLRRPADRAGPADDLPRQPRRARLRSGGRSARVRATIRATGAACSPTRRSCWRTRSRRSSRKSGAIRIPELKPRAVPPTVRRALADLPLATAEGEPAIDPRLGRAGPAARPRSCSAGTASRCWPGPPASRRNPVNVIPPAPRRIARSATRSTAIRARFLPAIRQALGEAGLGRVEVRPADRRRCSARPAPSPSTAG